jgi:hypothetical protein
MLRRKDIHGICTACKTGMHCEAALLHTIWECEQFEPYQNLMVKKFAKDVAKLAGKKGNAVVKEIESGKYKGQCYYCEVRETCTYPKPKGGAWECEDYR